MTQTVYENFDLLPAYTESLFSAASTNSLFFSRPWFDNFVANICPQDQRLHLFLVEPDPNHRVSGAVLPTWLPEATQGFFAPRTLHSLSNYYTGLFGPVMDYSDATGIAETMSRLVYAVTAQRPAWDMINLNPLEQHSPAYAALREAFRDAGWPTQDYFCFGNWYLPSEGMSFDDYLSGRSSRLRNTLRRKQRKFEREPDAHIQIITDSKGFNDALDAFQAAYARSWKNPEPYPNFVPGLARTCLEQGWLRLGVAWLRGRPVASQIWIVNNGVASIYKLAYDADFTNLSVGSILTTKLLEHVINVDHVREVDYLTGDDAYKKDWMSHRRERWGLIAFNPHTPRGLLAANRNIVGRATKQLLRRLVNRNSRHTLV